MRIQSIVKEESSFIGIDYHKRYSVFCVQSRVEMRRRSILRFS